MPCNCDAHRIDNISTATSITPHNLNLHLISSVWTYIKIFFLFMNIAYHLLLLKSRYNYLGLTMNKEIFHTVEFIAVFVSVITWHAIMKRRISSLIQKIESRNWFESRIRVMVEKGKCKDMWGRIIPYSKLDVF